MKRTAALSLAIVGAFLSACDKSSNVVTTPIGSVAIFSPSTGAIPLPNDLLLSGSTDGTLNAPIPSNPAQQGLFAAINALDGWSPTAPISVAFSEPIDPATVLPGAVRMFAVTTAGLSSGNAVTGIDSELTFGVDFVATATPDFRAIALLPLRALEPSSNYMVIVTDAVKDADGAATQRSIVYDLASDTAPLAADNPLKPLQGLIGAMQTAAVGEGIAKSSIVVSFTFQTQAIGTVLGTVATLVQGGESAVIAGLCGAAPVDCTDMSADPNLVASIGGFVELPSITTNVDLVRVFQGELTVPYFLTAAAAGGTGVDDLTQDPAPLLTWWNSRFDWLAPGTDDPNHVTSLNPLPATTGQVTIPVLVTVPKGAAPPVGGWPVAIFQHGITRNRSDLIGNAGTVEVSTGVFQEVLASNSVADAFALANYACVAIDLPLHGLDPSSQFGDPFPAELFAGYETAVDDLRERTFGLDLLDNFIGTPNPSGDGFADPSGAHFINLGSLRTTRDNLRQAVSDQLYLLSLIDQIDVTDGVGGPADGTPDLSGSDVHFVGHSLGAITGGIFLAYANQVRTVSSATLGMPGGQLAYLLQNSPNFSGQINGGLAAAGILPGTAEYNLFFVAAQTVAADADPLNYARLISPQAPPPGGPTPTPIHALEVVGEAPTFLPDQTIPNSAATAPLAGTEPYFAALGLDDIEADVPSGAPIFGAVRFIRGAHQSLPFPSLTTVPVATLDDTNTEMLAQTVEFAVSNGTMLTLVDETVIDTGP
ncbi:Ig-like domain-containing protein [Engelhardtia mirabilis]|uniref:Bacterial virulence factor lipase N-terminal domain-containing protein n=1 Tax=Engelhardtia mirabilis TaxID=2528011 RepID=A0A518BSM4_9BACT|nr:hypothetical protein Pla133_50990 [Planctomycetes bacterium Pla133]QDV04301.1 hypothetical protein Pla86_50960 [Planctomycetes bacterium Pla86]